MKTTIILFLLAFVTITTLAQEAPDTVQHDFKHVIYKDAKAAIQQLADALKVGSEHVYGILVKQQIVNSVVYLIILILSIIALTISFKQFCKVRTDGYGDVVDQTGIHIAFGLISGLPGILMLFMGLCSINTIVTGFINPEYGAIEKILELLH